MKLEFKNCAISVNWKKVVIEPHKRDWCFDEWHRMKIVQNEIIEFINWEKITNFPLYDFFRHIAKKLEEAEAHDAKKSKTLTYAEREAIAMEYYENPRHWRKKEITEKYDIHHVTFNRILRQFPREMVIN